MDEREAPVRIGVVDDHEVFRMGVRSGLQAVEGMTVAWDCGTGDQALRHMRRDPVDVVLLDLNLGSGSELDGFDTCRALTTGWPAVGVLIVTALDGRAARGRCLAAGAADVIEKDRPFSHLTAAIRSVSGRRARMAMARAHRRVTVPSLSPREQQVLELIGEGATTQMIALRLGLSPKTVDNHVHNLLRKLDAQNRTHAVAIFRQQVDEQALQR